MIKREKEAKLPSNHFVKTGLNSGTVWQIEKLESLDWIEKDQNLIILGNCATGKTAFASHIGRKALEAGCRVAYTTLEDYLLTVRNKGRRDTDRKKFQYYLSSSLIIIGEVMYTSLTNEELTMFYQSSMLYHDVPCYTKGNKLSTRFTGHSDVPGSAEKQTAQKDKRNQFFSCVFCLDKIYVRI